MKTESSAFAINLKYALATGGLLATLCGTGCSGLAQKTHVAASPADLRVLAFNEKLDVQTADRWINERWSYLMSFYSQDEDPYFGTSDVNKSCREYSVSGDVKIEHFDKRRWSCGSVWHQSSNAPDAPCVRGLPRSRSATRHKADLSAIDLVLIRI